MMSGNKISVKTLNLNLDFAEIANRLSGAFRINNGVMKLEVKPRGTKNRIYIAIDLKSFYAGGSVEG